MKSMPHKEFCNILGEKPSIIVKLVLNFKPVVIQDSEDGKESVSAKKNALEKNECCKMFREYRQAFAGAKALDEGKEDAPRTPLRASLTSSIPVRGQRSCSGDSRC